MVLGTWWTRLVAGVAGAFRTPYRALGTGLAGLMAFLIAVFSASPGYSLQMLAAGAQYWWLAFITRFSGMLATTGYTGVALTAVFAGLVGVTITNTVIGLRRDRISTGSIGAVPGFLAGGCASCGVGVLSVLGLGGVLASLPFEGNLLRLGGAVLLMVMIARTGDPETCKV